MLEPDLSRYERHQLDRMLYSYESLAREHADKGHYALAKWANRMRTFVVIELGRRDRADASALDLQLTLD